MGMFLNNHLFYDAYRAVAGTRFFIDKTWLIDELLDLVKTDNQKYICITRPRRFGKTVMVNMLGAFLGKNLDSSALFNKLKVSGSSYYQEYLNQYDIIYIDFSEEPEKCSSYDQYITRIIDGLKADLREEFPEIGENAGKSVWDRMTEITQKTGRRFVFLMDEWDAVFHMEYMTDKDHQAYLRFLKSLLKSKGYVEFAYMTGILPIAKYSDGSELNMFAEYHMATKIKFGEYFGFTDEEVDQLFAVYQKTADYPQITREELRTWYDGYYTASEKRVYNPRSVVCALTDNQLANYWTGSGVYDSLFRYIKDNVAGVQDDLPLLFAGEGITSSIYEYAASAMRLETKDEIYSAMVVYGLLTYKDGKVWIPNKELMDSYGAMMKKEQSLGYIYQLANCSRKMLDATLAKDTKTMAEILKYAHDTESPIFSYNSEIELSAIVNLVYLAAREQYRIEREDKAGEGYVDFIFYPQKKGADGIILELKVDGSPEEAIQQIKDRRYELRFKGKLGEKPKYTGRILAVGISYHRKTKEHFCKILEL